MLAFQVVSGPLHTPSGSPKLLRLYKKLCTIGRAVDNDLILADPQVQPSHAYAQLDRLDGDECVVVAVAGELSCAGKRKSRLKLKKGEVLLLGQTELLLVDEAEAKAQLLQQAKLAQLSPLPTSPRPSRRPESLAMDPAAQGAAQSAIGEPAALSAYKKLYEFSERLMHSYELSELLAALVDAVIDVTGASDGFLVLVQDGRPQVRVARNHKRENLGQPEEKLSVSIVDKVLKTEQPLIVSDALSDAEFQNAQSVMHLRLSSVMCVPLRERGHILGALYVGSSGVRNLFQHKDLQVLTVLAAQAGLILRNAMLVRNLQSDNQRLGEELSQLRATSVTGIGAGAGASPAMQEVLRTVRKVAGADVSVLITGETGTGKELIAQEIHRRSSRCKGPMVAINCGAIPEPLLESELFGHVRGAFTGAVAPKLGRFQVASGGTVFLDEIGEMPMGLQVKLLRVLQERAVTRVGDNRAEPIDVRVLAATHRDLPAEIRAGRFREDLYYRLNVVQIHLPPLRERGDDVLILAHYFLRRFADELQLSPRTLTPGAELALRRHPFPGNIRQLENVIKKALVLSEQTELSPEDLGMAAVAQPKVLPLHDAKERFVQKYVSEILALHNGNKTRAAQVLGVDVRTVFRFLHREEGSRSEPESAHSSGVGDGDDVGGDSSATS